MKILFVSDVYFPRVNGVSTSIQTFRHELRALGHEVHLIAPDYHAPTDDEEGILRVPARSLPFDPEDRLMRLGWAAERFARLRSAPYDIVHVHTPFVAHYLGLRLARMMDIPCVETYHTFFEEYFHHYLPFLPRSLTRMAARRLSQRQGNSLHGMVVPSRPMLDALRQYGVNTPIEIIPTGLRPQSFADGNGAAFRVRHGIAAERPMLLFVGRVAHEKNIGFLLDVACQVCRQIPDVLFLIAGEGPARAGLERAVEQRGMAGHVRFLGYLDRATELNDCYRAADLFVFASRTETQGLVLLEAMAQGTPLVSTAEMGTRDVLEEGAGVWISCEDATEFAGKVVRLLGDRPARSALGAAGREYARRWSAAGMAQRLAAFYESIVAARRAVISSMKRT